MLDAAVRPLINPPLERLGRALAARGISADAMTLIGLAVGFGAAAVVAAGHFWAALVLILISRLADGLDGAIARASQRTDFGGFLDITADFAFYAAIPLAFVLHDPATNGVAGAVLLAAFYVNGTSFLGYALLAEKHGLISTRRGVKNLYFSGGLVEGTETIGFLVLVCLVPHAFAWLALAFAALTAATTLHRVHAARRTFGGSAGSSAT